MGETEQQPTQTPAEIEEPAVYELPTPHTLDAAGLDVLFRTARTYNAWFDVPVTHAEILSLYDLLRLGPTSANTSPARFVFLQSRHSRQRLLPALSPGNVDKVLAAPLSVIVGHDPRFYDQLPQLFPHTDARAWYATNPELAEETAFRNGTLQGAYLIAAARAIGLDCGPMSGFDRQVVDRDVMGDYGWKSNFLVNLGHGDPAHLLPRGPRLSFDQACVVL